jgi:hypothetical protein
MHFNLGTTMVVTTLVASAYLLFHKSDRMFPTIAVIASGIQALIVFGLMSLSLSKFRIDVVLPAVLVVCGVVCWGKVSEKGTTTAATLLTAIGAMELLLALRIFS